MRLIFSLLAKLLYLLRLKGYLSPSQLWLHRNYFSVNLSLRDVPSSCTFKISQCVCACVPFFFALCTFFFSSKWNPFCLLVKWEPNAGNLPHPLNCLTPPPPSHFLLSAKSATISLYSSGSFSCPEGAGTGEYLQSPVPTGASHSIALFPVIQPWPHITG